MNRLNQFCQSPLAWASLILSALSLELSALYFQYGMELDPCVMCIYIRVAVLGILLAGCIGFIAPTGIVNRLLGFSLWGISALWGLKLSMELVGIQNDPSPFSTCSFLPEFPMWMPLHEWLPSIFMPTGMCSDVPWQWMGVTMGEWMIFGFAIYTLVWVTFLPVALRKPVVRG